MIARLVRFRSTLPDEGTFDAKGNVIEPGGRRHADLLYPRLKSGILKNAVEPSNEENYAWEFIGKVNGVNISFIVGRYFDAVDAEKQFQVLISAFFFAWLHRERSELAVAVAAQALVDILRADHRMRDIQNITDEEDQKLIEITRQQLQGKRK